MTTQTISNKTASESNKKMSVENMLLAESLCIGERVEAVYQSKKSSSFGQYMGCDGLCDVVESAGYRFIISRYMGDGECSWRVVNRNNLREFTVDNVNDLAYAIEQTLKQFEVPVSEFRDSIRRLEDQFHVHRHACVRDSEREQWKSQVLRVLANLELTVCKRPRAEDVIRRDVIVKLVRDYLNISSN